MEPWRDGEGMEPPVDIHFLRESRARFGRPQIIGHRGGKTFAPENTLAAFLACWRNGGDACEMDVRLTRDGGLVVMHDPTVDRTTNGTGTVAEMPLAEVTALRVAGEPVPSLRDVLGALPSGRGLQLHVKVEESDERTTQLLRTLAEMLRTYGLEERCHVLATEPRALSIVESNPRLRLDVEIHGGPVGEALAKLGRAFFLEGGHRLKTSDFDLADDAMVRDAHREGIPLVSWARDSSDESVERLLRLGVDAIMTDYPERMAALIARIEALCEEAG
jgi:glycerophosphoryl diester phosphodiesterase